MRKLTLRRLFSLAGLTLTLGAVAFVAYGASIDCPDTSTKCVGTEFADTLDDAKETLTLRGLGGDDSFTLDDDGGSGILSATGTDDVFGGPGDDRFLILTVGDAEIVFGEDGDDSFKVADPGSNATLVQAAQHTLDGGRGDDFLLIEGPSDRPSVTVFDGPGADTILFDIASSGTNTGHTVRLTADNEQDTVRGGPGSDTIELQKGSGRDVIDCGSGGGTVMLQGNRKATDTQGNNLRKAALLGGTAQTGCDTIIP